MTSIEPTPAERAVSEALHLFLKARGQIGPETPADFFEAAVDIAAAAEGHHHLAAYREAEAALAELREARRGPWPPNRGPVMRDVIAGIEQAREHIAQKADALAVEVAPCAHTETEVGRCLSCGEPVEGGA